MCVFLFSLIHLQWPHHYDLRHHAIFLSFLSLISGIPLFSLSKYSVHCKKLNLRLLPIESLNIWVHTAVLAWLLLLVSCLRYDNKIREFCRRNYRLYGIDNEKHTHTCDVNCSCTVINVHNSIWKKQSITVICVSLHNETDFPLFAPKADMNCINC